MMVMPTTHDDDTHHPLFVALTHAMDAYFVFVRQVIESLKEEEYEEQPSEDMCESPVDYNSLRQQVWLYYLQTYQCLSLYIHDASVDLPLLNQKLLTRSRARGEYVCLYSRVPTYTPLSLTPPVTTPQEPRNIVFLGVKGRQCSRELCLAMSLLPEEVSKYQNLHTEDDLPDSGLPFQKQDEKTLILLYPAPE
jgi:hypothetical protein